MKRILLALSGGVDSSVAAHLLLRQGYRVEAVYMRTWMDEAGSGVFADCPWEEDIRAARQAADQLGIPFQILNMIDAYRQRVVNYLVDGYRSGRTPNPDIMCNREIKFGVLRDYALSNSYDGLATGHYARLTTDTAGLPLLQQGVDPDKDQSYFLAMVKRDALNQVLFPIGDYHKADIRKIAAEIDLPNADRKDSQGICFLGRVPINQFLQQYIPDQPGPIINHRNEVIGTHRGLHRFTIGQRKGLGVPSNCDFEHYVVIAKDYSDNALHVAFDRPDTEELYHDKVTIIGLNAIATLPQHPCQLQVRTRYRDPLIDANYTPLTEDSAQLSFASPQRALASGQVVALHQADRLIGGGVYRIGNTQP